MNVQAHHADRLRHSEEVRKRHFTVFSGQQISLVGCFDIELVITISRKDSSVLSAFSATSLKTQTTAINIMNNEELPPHSPQLEHTETICFSATSSQKNNPYIQISIH